MRALKVLPVFLLLGLGLVPTPSQAALSGENGGFAFVKNDRIYLMGPDGTGQVALSQVVGNRDNNPAWSPDAKTLAFDTIEGAGVPNIWVADRRNQNRRNIAGNLGGYVEGTDPTWAPNGLKIAYVCPVAGGETDICVVKSDGTGSVNITNKGGNDYQPSFSPDGRKIAFVSERDIQSEIYTINADGTGLQRITTNSAVDSYPAWSPDGTKLAFISAGELIVADTHGQSTVILPTGGGVQSGLTFSPDGTLLAYTANKNSNIDIFTIPVGGGTPVRLTTDVVPETLPDWNRIPIQGTDAPDDLVGTGVVDVILGEGGDDTIRAGGGDDFAIGGSGADTLKGQAGNDVLAGEELDTSSRDPNGGNDKLIGGGGNDLVLGGGGNDRAKGGGGKDTLRGDAGNDYLDGGKGFDRLNGGKGKDTCVVDSKKEERKASKCEKFRRHY